MAYCIVSIVPDREEAQTATTEEAFGISSSAMVGRTIAAAMGEPSEVHIQAAGADRTTIDGQASRFSPSGSKFRNCPGPGQRGARSISN